MRTLTSAVLGILVLLLVQGCEDDPILEPTGDDSGGGSYGVIAPLSGSRPVGHGGSNPEIF
jgi:hypothetical protein